MEEERGISLDRLSPKGLAGLLLDPHQSALALSPQRQVQFLSKRGSRSSVSGPPSPPPNNDDPARDCLTFYSGLVLLLAAEIRPSNRN